MKKQRSDKEVCFWSVGDHQYALYLQGMVNTYHRIGMEYDFHVFSDRPIQGAVTHPISNMDKEFYIFKLALLNTIQSLDYRYFVFVDADTFFVRKPPDFLHLMEDTDFHIFLETDCASPKVKREAWRTCPLTEYVRLMHEMGVESEKIYNVNAGFFIVARSAIEEVCKLALNFWIYMNQNGYIVTEEAPLAYAMQMLCRNTEPHLMKNNFNLWATDWTGQFGKGLPDGTDWIHTDYMTGEFFIVNPAIVHVMHGKEGLKHLA